MTEYIVELNDSPKITIDGWNVRCDDWLIQREEIVRCRDCRHRVAFEQPLNLERVFCDLRRSLYAVEDEGFCAWGVRRDS